MNKQRRKTLSEITSKLEECISQLQDVIDAEQESYDNLPESLQDGDKGQAMSTAIDNMEATKGSIEDAMNSIEEASE